MLVEELGSEEVYQMHLGYEDFLKIASEEEKGYYKFASIRNPLDSVVSAYFKKRADHNGRFSRGTFKKGKPIAPAALAEYDFIVNQGADFPTYFKEFFKDPYHRPKHEATVRNMNALIRFENLQADFNEIMDQLALPQLEIPIFNKTAERRPDFLTYYTPEIKDQAIRCFSPIMADWGYDFPPQWKE